MTQEPRRARYGEVFGIAEFRAVFAAHVISMLGQVIAAVALTVLVYEKTGSPALAALTFSAAFPPYLFSGTLLSSMVDRLPARRVLVACNLASALVVGSMALVALPVWALLGLLFVLGLIAPVFSGVRAATLTPARVVLAHAHDEPADLRVKRRTPGSFCAGRSTCASRTRDAKQGAWLE